MSVTNLTDVVATTPSQLPGDVGTLMELAAQYNTTFADLQAAVDSALAAVEADPSNPATLAMAQAAISDLANVEAFVSALIKAFRSMDSTILGNIG